MRLFKEVDKDKDGIVKYKEFEQYYNQNYDERVKEIEREKNAMNMQYEIFDHLMKVLSQKSLSLVEVFDQIDMDQNGYIECDEFQNLLERLGFTVSEAHIFEIMRQMDENFDGRISYKELRDHIKSLGFNLSAADNPKGQSLVAKKGSKTLHALLNKKPFEDYFKQFDEDHDGYLSPLEFRQSLLSIKGVQLKKF